MTIAVDLGCKATKQKKKKRGMQKSIYILVCASVRTCDNPQESF